MKCLPKVMCILSFGIRTFWISPLEAMQVGTPSIVSVQSGCAEILNNAIKIDYWILTQWLMPYIPCKDIRNV
jgi:glycosyltransferase involved in cell wall biosynthesis